MRLMYIPDGYIRVELLLLPLFPWFSHFLISLPLSSLFSLRRSLSPLRPSLSLPFPFTGKSTSPFCFWSFLLFFSFLLWILLFFSFLLLFLLWKFTGFLFFKNKKNRVEDSEERKEKRSLNYLFNILFVTSLSFHLKMKKKTF